MSSKACEKASGLRDYRCWSLEFVSDVSYPRQSYQKECGSPLLPPDTDGVSQPLGHSQGGRENRRGTEWQQEKGYERSAGAAAEGRHPVRRHTLDNVSQTGEHPGPNGAYTRGGKKLLTIIIIILHGNKCYGYRRKGRGTRSARISIHLLIQSRSIHWAPTMCLEVCQERWMESLPLWSSWFQSLPKQENQQ